MITILDITLIIHLIGLALLLGGSVTGLLSRPTAEAASFRHMLWIGAVIQLLSGLILTGTLEAIGAEVDHLKIAAKLLVLTSASTLAITFARRPPRPAWMLWGTGGLTLLTTGIAVLW